MYTQTIISVSFPSLFSTKQLFPRYLRRRIIQQQPTQKFRCERASKSADDVADDKTEGKAATEKEKQFSPSTHGIGRGDAATPPAITDIVAARNGGEWARVNFPWVARPTTTTTTITTTTTSDYVPLCFSHSSEEADSWTSLCGTNGQHCAGDSASTLTRCAFFGKKSERIFLRGLCLCELSLCASSSLCWASNAGIYFL